METGSGKCTCGDLAQPRVIGRCRGRRRLDGRTSPHSPLDVGESRVENVRTLTVRPLAVYYDVFPDVAGNGLAVGASAESELLRSGSRS